MPTIADSSGTLFRPYTFEREAEFERQIVKMSDLIFGSSTLYIDVKKQIKGNDIISIPDAYLVDMTDATRPNLFVIENEIVGHDPFKHIGIQMLRFVTSFEDAKTQVRNFLMSEIVSNSELKDRLEKGSNNGGSRNIDNYLDKAVYGEFKGLVVIDEAKPELHNVLTKINARISVIEFKAFKSDDDRWVYVYDTLYDEDDGGLDNNATDPDARARRRERRAECDTLIVPAREEGFQDVFLDQNCWYAVRIGAAMRDRIKYIAAYQVSPVSAVTHIAEVRDIRPHMNTGKYRLEFVGPAKEIGPISLKDSKFSPQGPVYAKYDQLVNASSLDEALQK